MAMKVKVKLLSHFWLFVTSVTIAYQVPPSMGFSRQECWSCHAGLPRPSPGDLPNSGTEPESPTFMAIYVLLLCWGIIPLYPIFENFYHKWMWDFIKCFFFTTIELIIWFLSLILLMCCASLIDFQLLNHLCIPGINLTWWWCVIFLLYC